MNNATHKFLSYVPVRRISLVDSCDPVTPATSKKVETNPSFTPAMVDMRGNISGQYLYTKIFASTMIQISRWQFSHILTQDNVTPVLPIIPKMLLVGIIRRAIHEAFGLPEDH
jgi:hypothetical protein